MEAFGHPLKEKKLVWENIIFFAVTTLGAVIGVPWYLRRHGISAPEIGLLLFYMASTGLAIQPAITAFLPT